MNDILICGGFRVDKTRKVSGKIGVFSCATGEFFHLKPMPVAVAFHSLIFIDPFVYLFGGQTDEEEASKGVY